MQELQHRQDLLEKRHRWYGKVKLAKIYTWMESLCRCMINGAEDYSIRLTESDGGRSRRVQMEFKHGDYDCVRLFDILCDVAVRKTRHRGLFGVEIKALVGDKWASVTDIDALLATQCPDVRLFMYSYWWGEPGSKGARQRLDLVHELRRGVRHIIRDMSANWKCHQASDVAGLVYPPDFPLPATFFIRKRAFLDVAGPPFDEKLEMEMWRRTFRVTGHADTTPKMDTNQGRLKSEFYVWTPDGEAFAHDFVRK
ncbi:hypothetical protein QKT49_gp254 [Acanthamoeba castellanii medusavirus]|uniref:Uncharacterized protein n=1 Tax=Acanthamoeba castellanii medusavirus J1 TaxID=3114988 RepID=A0A3T1CXI7_9VIRU|nr:hypothetical protein QKT49_gp254 [Acanthamoeba castellanii medusavirus]BBI30509.1 hypothetical protein [Acanthamoeba castellanii medusavirus J1]